jgi:hypothetical protein
MKLVYENDLEAQPELFSPAKTTWSKRRSSRRLDIIIMNVHWAKSEENDHYVPRGRR